MARRYAVVIKNGNVRQIYRAKEGGFTFNRKLAKTPRFGKKSRKRLLKWANRKGVDVEFTKSKFVFLEVDSDTRLPKRSLTRKLNQLGRRLRKRLFINEGWRTHARQWELYRQYGPGRAAYPGTSNHEGGNAADIQLYNTGITGWRYNIGDNPKARAIMKSLGLCLPVGGESWHVEQGWTWRV